MRGSIKQSAPTNELSAVSKYIIFHIIRIAENLSRVLRRGLSAKPNKKDMIDMNIHTYGTDERLGYCREYLYEKNIHSVREIILLPIPTSRDGITVLGTGKTPEMLFGDSLAGAVAVGYGIPKAFKEYFSKMGACTADVSLDGKFLEDNAYLTAEGTVGKILTEHSSAPSELSIGIIGYGRIGKRLVNILAFLGASLRVFTKRCEIAEELCMSGISGVCMTGDDKTLAEAFSGLDIIINTAPAPLVFGCALDSLSDTEIIELASGDNFPKGTKITRLPSLPAKMYPRSAGKVLADSVLRMIE